jgi:hypothetical protein
MLEYSLNVSDADTVTDGEKLFIRCALTAKLYLLMPGEISRLYSCEISEGELPIEDGSKITVYYPKKNENLFDIAKRYRTTSAKIALDNNLSESVMASPDSSDSLLGVKKLIIK